MGGVCESKREGRGGATWRYSPKSTFSSLALEPKEHSLAGCWS